MTERHEHAETARPDHRVSVVVITRNRREELLRTLRLLRELPERPPVLVVDTASSDGTAEEAAARPLASITGRPSSAPEPKFAISHRQQFVEELPRSAAYDDRCCRCRRKRDDQRRPRFR